MLKNKISVIIALILVFSCIQAVTAQDNGTLPVYIVQPGENMTEIAQKFNITLQELINANNLIDPNFISAGTQLFIPGLEGVSGVLTTEEVNFGDQLRSILLRNRLSTENFKKMNPVTSPTEIFVGSTLVLPQTEGESFSRSNAVLGLNDSQFISAIQNNLNPWTYFVENGFEPSSSLPGDVFYYPAGDQVTTVSSFSDQITRIEVSPLPVSQGHTSSVYIYAKSPGEFSGTYGSKTIHFFQDAEEGFFYALNGVSAIAEPGLIPLRITGQFENGDEFSIEQYLLLTSGGYRNETLTVEQTTVEEAVIKAENEQIQALLEPVSQEKLWEDTFRFPVDGSLEDDSIAFSSYFGSRRSYNNGQHTGYHGGLDFSVVLMSLNIYASAPGRVIYAGPMNIRGNTVFIDHGQGVVSGYAHMQEFNVNSGDFVDQGQLIGLIGKTGRVTGPHLHWDIWVNRTPVDPFDWIENRYP
ncbi:MAG: LysM peptidoglycan-binding domain-containing protein [Chloroflexi bacterium]|nr:LysM peptidoglycan-binding domain-containing protein [Chloroflexota bacterium]